MAEYIERNLGREPFPDISVRTKSISVQLQTEHVNSMCMHAQNFRSHTNILRVFLSACQFNVCSIVYFTLSSFFVLLLPLSAVLFCLILIDFLTSACLNCLKPYNVYTKLLSACKCTIT